MNDVSTIKAVLIKERELNGDEGYVQLYEVGKYSVIVRGPRNSTGNHLWVEVRKRNDITDARYLPNLIENCFDDEGRACRADMRIGTTSYGSLSMEEATKFMKAMDEGFATAQYICDKFLQPMMVGTWNWKVMI